VEREREGKGRRKGKGKSKRTRGEGEEHKVYKGQCRAVRGKERDRRGTGRRGSEEGARERDRGWKGDGEV
jgi:hypothetical protein